GDAGGGVGVRAVFIGPVRRRFDIPVYPKELLAAATKGRIGVEDLTTVVLEEYAVTGEILQPGIHVFVVVEGAARRELFEGEGDVEVIVEIRVVGRDPGEAPTHSLTDGLDLVDRRPRHDGISDIGVMQVYEHAFDMVDF